MTPHRYVSNLLPKDTPVSIERSDKTISIYTDFLLLAVFVSMGLSWVLHATSLEDDSIVDPSTIDLDDKRWVTRTFVPDSMLLRSSQSFDLDAWEAPFIQFDDVAVRVFDGCTEHIGTYNSKLAEVRLQAPITVSEQCKNEKRQSALYFQKLFADGRASLSFDSIGRSTSSTHSADTYVRLILKQGQYRVSGTAFTIQNN